MFYRAKLLVAAACLLAAAASARAQTYLAPYVAATSTGSVALVWTDPGGPYTAVISTSDTFAAAFSTASQTNSPFIQYPDLDPNTTYYHKVKVTGEADDQANQVSTATWVVPPYGMYSSPSYFTADSSYTAVAAIGWAVDDNPAWTLYDLSYRQEGGPATVVRKTNAAGAPISVAGLTANTTYHFKVRGRGVSGMLTGYTSEISTTTLALRLSGMVEAVHRTSATVSWEVVNHETIPALDSNGYRINFSPNESMTGAAVVDIPDTETSSATFSGLTPNTSYYYKAGALNWPGTANMSGVRRFTTLSPPPAGLAFAGVADGSATLTWTALGAAEADGYRLEASVSESFSSGETTHSSATYSTALNSLRLNTLYPNTTYYFRVAALNKAFAPNYSAVISTITLALPVTPGLTYPSAQPQSITMGFTPLPESPQALTCEGYRLEGSSSNFSGGTVFSSATYTYYNGLRQLRLEGLAPNTTYYLRLGTLNWSHTPNYSILLSTRTGFPQPLADVQLVSLSSFSAAISFTPGVAAGGHTAEASEQKPFIITASSTSPSGAISGLSIKTGLAPNTLYYFRAGALYNGTTLYTNASPEYGHTLSAQLEGMAFSGVFQSSATLSWNVFAGSAKSLLLEVSDSESFSEIIDSSSSLNTTLDTLSVSNLLPNATYYFRAATINAVNYPNYTATLATATLANPPIESEFNLTPNSINLTWEANGNPADTQYTAEMDLDPDFISIFASSGTLLSSATFSGLSPNTIYYSRVTAINRHGRAIPPVVFSSMATGAYDPVNKAPTSIGAFSFCANWDRGDNLAETTYYKAEISSSTDFSGLAPSSTTLSLSATFYGLVSNATYYARVSALNLTNVFTDPPVALTPPALTLPTTPYILAATHTFSNMLMDGFSVNWASNGNSSHTYYQVRASTDPAFSVINSTRLVQALSCGFSDLLVGVTYWVQLKALGQTGAESVYADVERSTRTLSQAQRNSLILEDTTVLLETSYGPISVLLPAGSIGISTRLMLEPLYSFPDRPSAVAPLTPTGIGISITHHPPTLVLNAITITLPYRPADMPGSIDTSKLVLALYDETNSVWVPLPSVSDTANNRVIAQTWHLSTFQIMQSNPGTGLGAVKIYPNPYTPNSEAGLMHFAGTPPYARVKIYTFLGELVRSLKADINGMAHWDGLNDKGREAASGVYIALVQTADKGSSKSFKVALER